MLKLIRGVLVFIMLVAGQLHSGLAATVSGPAALVDGDTLWVGSTEIRIHGIDAPEPARDANFQKERGIAPLRRLTRSPQ